MDLTLPDAVAGIVVIALNAYLLLGGADFGGGVWDLLASGPRKDRQREVIAHAIGPVWEANHVWLILAIVLLFTCFPVVFAQLAVALHVPLTLILIGIVLRGSAFTFRAYADENARQRYWGRVFAGASVVTPLLLGVSVGAVASGAVGFPPEASAGFRSGYIDPWFTPFGWATGFLALASFGFLAAVYLTMETDEVDLQEDFRRRALASGVAVFLAAGLTLLLSGGAPAIRAGLVSSARAIPIHLGTALAALTAFGALLARRWALARVAAAAQVSLILWGWAASQYPYLLPPRVTIGAAAAPPVTLRLVLIALGVGAMLLFPSLAYLFRVFKARRPAA